MNGDTEMVRLLLNASAKPFTASPRTPLNELMCAASGGYADIVRLLLDAGANPDEQAMDGETALHWAATNGHVSVVEALLDAGASPFIRNRDGKTPLQVARQVLSAWTGRNRHPFAKLNNPTGYKACITFLQAAEKASRAV